MAPHGLGSALDRAHALHTLLGTIREESGRNGTMRESRHLRTWSQDVTAVRVTRVCRNGMGFKRSRVQISSPRLPQGPTSPADLHAPSAEPRPGPPTPIRLLLDHEPEAVGSHVGDRGRGIEDDGL